MNQFSRVRFIVCMLIATVFSFFSAIVGENISLGLRIFFFIFAFIVQLCAMRPAREGGPWAWEKRKEQP